MDHRGEVRQVAPAERWRVLVEVTRTFAELVSAPEQLLAAITEQTGRLLEGCCLLGLVSEDRQSWRLCAEYSPDARHPAEVAGTLDARPPTSMDPTPTPSVARPCRAAMVGEWKSEAWQEELESELWARVERHALRGAICVPMRTKGEVLGTLTVGRTGGTAQPFDSGDIDLLQVLADHAAQTILHARSHEAVQRELFEHRRTRESLRLTEEKLCQASKMEAVGRLAGGVAHDFNNILSVVVGYSECLLDALGPGPVRSDVEEIHRAGIRAATLTRQLLAFSRKQVLAPCAVDLNQVIDAMEPMLRRVLGEDVVLHIVPAPDLHRCLVDRGQMEQILMNLVVNARDAMALGGQLTIETSNVVLDEEYVALHPDAKLGPHAVMSVTDTGVGMDRATLKRIYEPFFTTKPKGSGTGLGLATVHGIVHQSGGTILVYSEPGRGTTFKVQLPMTDDPAGVERATPVATLDELRGSETVLVVEDDPQVRGLIRTVLDRCGYHVLDASGGEEAELVCERLGRSPKLLLTDVVMPNLSGRQVAERLTKRFPGLDVLYMSGYAEHAIVNHGVLDSSIHFIPKPITPTALLRRVREVLSRSGTDHARA